MAGGRPTKLTPKTHKKIVAYIGDRVPYLIAAEASGIDESTLYDWINWGKRDSLEGKETVFSRFAKDIKEIEAKRIKEHLKIIETSPERWQAQAWILERRWWKHFGQKVAEVDFDERLRKIESDQALSQGEIVHGKD